MSRVGIVIASHSDLLARGVAELAGQMAPGVVIGAAGGLEDGGLGTSYDRIEAALEAVLTAVDGPGSGAVVLTDLGSATMTAESVVEMSEAPERIRLVDTALVEGAVAAAVRAEVGDSLDDVARAAASVRFGAQDQGAPDHAGEAGAGGCGCAGSSGSGGPGGPTGGAPTGTAPDEAAGAGTTADDRGAGAVGRTGTAGASAVSGGTPGTTAAGAFGGGSAGAAPASSDGAPVGLAPAPSAAGTTGTAPEELDDGEERAEGDAVVADPVGLHARPAALFVRLAGTFESRITVNGASGASVLEIMSLGVAQGDTVHLTAVGEDARAAIAALTDMLEQRN